MSRSVAAARKPLAEIIAGGRYAWRNKVVFALLCVSTTVLMFGYPYVAFLPSVADELFDAGSSGYSILSIAGAVGGIIVTLFIARRARGPMAWTLLWISGIGFAAAEIGLGLSPTLAVASLALVGLGATGSAFQSISASLVLEHSERAYHGRLQSLLQLGFSGFGLAALPLGALADAIGLRELLIGMGVVVLVATIAFEVARTRPV